MRALKLQANDNLVALCDDLLNSGLLVGEGGAKLRGHLLKTFGRMRDIGMVNIVVCQQRLGKASVVSVPKSGNKGLYKLDVCLF
ncbi:hypothetical protein YDYSG_62960 [Paenibacillus tyrfis]|nr:hypothetical protein YDYSG_62960 [Paenibacillus tyrfis]